MGNTVELRKCPQCGRMFTPLTWRNKYCSVVCSEIATVQKRRLYEREKCRTPMNENAKKKGASIKLAPVDSKKMWCSIVSGMKETGLSYGEYVARMDGFK